MGLRDNFRQAARELAGFQEEPAKAPMETAEIRIDSDVDDAPAAPAAFAAPSVEFEQEAPVAVEPAAPVAPVVEAPEVEMPVVEMPIVEMPAVEPVAAAPVVETPVAVPEAPKKEYGTTVIADGVVITGNVMAEGSLVVSGEINGDVVTKQNLQLNGKIMGNVGGANVELAGGLLKGNLVAVGTVVVNASSVVVGDLQAKNMSSDGRVKGNLTVQETLVLGPTAVVSGKITAGRLTVNDGAICLGEVCITSANNVDALFKDI